ncbi:MAG: DUF2256 domain-containing protein [Flavobacteriaceae bacterium]|nr:DUF2256 domain-containing protein [Flavobacteriaceae bacterium]MDG0966917.1 DUF2256 domain-containing protein [Flavobacteriaceae bacterium]
MKGVKKTDLPSKRCVVCELPFSWRKKWTKNWKDVKYCSKKCKRNKKQL